MLARNLLSSCPLSVGLSVCHKPALYRNEWTNRASFWHAGFISPIPRCDLRRFLYFQKLGYFLWNFVPNSGLGKFRHGKSIALSTKLVIVVVDGRVWMLTTLGAYTTTDESWLFTTSRSTVTIQLDKPTSICCKFVVQLASTIDKIFTGIARRAVCLL